MAIFHGINIDQPPAGSASIRQAVAGPQAPHGGPGGAALAKGAGVVGGPSGSQGPRPPT